MTPAPESCEALALTVEQLGADLDASDCEEGGRAEVLYEVAEELRAMEKRCGELEAEKAYALTRLSEAHQECGRLEAERGALAHHLRTAINLRERGGGPERFTTEWRRALTQGAEVRDGAD